MPGFDEHHLDATVADLERAAGQHDETPRWLTGLIAKHGQPVSAIAEPTRMGDAVYQVWGWRDMNVRIAYHASFYAVTARRGSRLARLGGLKRYPTDADISTVVALAGLCDAPEVAS